MELKVLSDDGDVLELAVVGRVVQSDSTPPPELIGDLLGGNGYARNVLLSLADIDFIDSSGLAWLVLCHKRFCQAGGKLVLHSSWPAILEVFELMGLHRAFHVAEDSAAAMELVAARE